MGGCGLWAGAGRHLETLGAVGLGAGRATISEGYFKTISHGDYPPSTLVVSPGWRNGKCLGQAD